VANNLTPPLFIEVSVPSKESERSCICVPSSLQQSSLVRFMSGLAFNLHVENNCLTPSFRKEEVWPINVTPSRFIEMSVPSKESERSGIYVFRQFGNCLFLKGMGIRI